MFLRPGTILFAALDGTSRRNLHVASALGGHWFRWGFLLTVVVAYVRVIFLRSGVL